MTVRRLMLEANDSARAGPRASRYVAFSLRPQRQAGLARLRGRVRDADEATERPSHPLEHSAIDFADVDDASELVDADLIAHAGDSFEPSAVV
jgi:hypothetical protein